MAISDNWKTTGQLILDRANLSALLAGELLVTESEKYVPVDTQKLRRNVKVSTKDKSTVQIQYLQPYAAAQYFGNLKHKVTGGEPQRIVDFAPPKKRGKKAGSGGSSRKARYSRGYRKLKKDGSLQVLPKRGKWAERALNSRSTRRKIDAVMQRVFNKP